MHAPIKTSVTFFHRELFRSNTKIIRTVFNRPLNQRNLWLSKRSLIVEINRREFINTSSYSALDVALVSSLLAVLLLFPNLTWAIDIEGESEELAQESQNPVGNLINLRFENNSLFNVGPTEDDYGNVFNFIPVYPGSLGEDWNWINRIIIPVVYRENLPSDGGSSTGLSDILYQGYLSPAKPGKVIWGLGPAVLAPTGASDFTTDQWSVGATVVVLVMPGHWVMGLLPTQVWSVDESDDRPDVNLFTLQYFVNYNMDDGWYLTSTPVIKANWEADSDNTWTVPVGGGIGRVFNIGNQANNVRLQAYYNLEHPDGVEDWSLQLQWTFLLPKW